MPLIYFIFKEYEKASEDPEENTGLEKSPEVDFTITGSSVTPEQISMIETVYEENNQKINQLSLINDKT